jgi:hypothetical protein
MDHTRPFQLSLVSCWCGPRLLPENRPGRMLLKLLSPIPHLLPIAGPINEIVNLHSNDTSRRRGALVDPCGPIRRTTRADNLIE